MKKSEPVNPDCAVRQLERLFAGIQSIPDGPVVPSDGELICTIVYDLKNPDPAKRIRYEYPNRS